MVSLSRFRKIRAAVREEISKNLGNCEVIEPTDIGRLEDFIFTNEYSVDSHGCWLNLHRMTSKTEATPVAVYVHKSLPCNDYFYAELAFRHFRVTFVGLTRLRKPIKLYMDGRRMGEIRWSLTHCDLKTRNGVIFSTPVRIGLLEAVFKGRITARLTNHADHSSLILQLTNLRLSENELAVWPGPQGSGQPSVMELYARIFAGSRLGVAYDLETKLFLLASAVFLKARMGIME